MTSDKLNVNKLASLCYGNNESSVEKMNDIVQFSYDSYMVPEADLLAEYPGALRLLEVDNSLYLPMFSRVRLDVTAEDVLHSFAVPSLGIKVDAVPGRLNVAYVDIARAGIFYGQCSEICGVNHGYMPIQLVVIDINEYMAWILQSSIGQGHVILEHCVPSETMFRSIFQVYRPASCVNDNFNN
jgi:cytochrome c oxidase subunit 2